MDGYTVQTPKILGTLSLGEKKTVDQYRSLAPFAGSSLIHLNNHDYNGFQPLSSIPQSFSQDHLEKATKLNGCKFGLHMGNEHMNRLSPLPNFSIDGEPGTNISGPRPLYIEYQRPRSHSMGIAVAPVELQTSRSHSRDSLASCGSLVNEYQLPKNDVGSEEALVEVTCNKFKRLSTGGVDSPHSISPISQCHDSTNLSHSPPMCDPDVVRKYSFGSHVLTAKRQLSRHGHLSNHHGLPIDLTCKRKKSDATSSSLGSLFLQSGEICQNDQLDQINSESKQGSPFEDKSILKSVLVGMGRKRSHTLSVCGRQHFRKDSPETPMGIAPRQRVTLAKRNLGPVMGRISEFLNKTTQLLSSQVDFMKLSAEDRKSLITDSVHRLLMLYVAESNLQFVVTPVRDDDDKSIEEGGIALEEPTMQFTEAVQNFISKCQALNISSSEYALLRLMTLFHTGSRSLDDDAAVEKAKAEAQQNLQSLVQHCYPNDRLRYSKLLLSIYTLFGINCQMLEALFCRHLISGDGSGNGGSGGGGGGGGGSGLAQFVHSEFLASNVPSLDC